MSDISVTAAQVGLVKPLEARIVPYLAGATITAGQAIYRYTDGTAKLTDANTAPQFRGVALNGGAAGQAIDVCESGLLYGFGLSGLNADAMVYLSNTEGALGASAGSTSVVAGRIVCLTDKSATKVLQVFARPEADWS